MGKQVHENDMGLGLGYSSSSSQLFVWDDDQGHRAVLGPVDLPHHQVTVLRATVQLERACARHALLVGETIRHSAHGLVRMIGVIQREPGLLLALRIHQWLTTSPRSAGSLDARGLTDETRRTWTHAKGAFQRAIAIALHVVDVHGQDRDDSHQDGRQDDQRAGEPPSAACRAIASSGRASCLSALQTSRTATGSWVGRCTS